MCVFNSIKEMGQTFFIFDDFLDLVSGPFCGCLIFINVILLHTVSESVCVHVLLSVPTSV